MFLSNWYQLLKFTNKSIGDLMKNISIWKDNIKSINYKKLDKNLDIDILIIGGGITGISALYHLKNSNLKIILVEQNKI